MSRAPTFWPDSFIREQVPAALVGPGKQVTLDLDGIRSVAHGRAAHIKFIQLQFVVALTTTAGDMVEALRSIVTRRIVSNLRVVAAGHRWFDNVDGEDLERYHQALRGNADVLAEAVVPDADGTPSVSVTVTIPFAAGPLAREDAADDRLMPLALFQGTGSNRGYVQFNIPSTLATGVTVSSITSLHQVVVLTWRDRFMQPAPTKLHVVETANKFLNLSPEFATDMLYVCNRAEAAADRDHSDYTLQSFQVNGRESLLYPDITAGELNGMHLVTRRGFGEDSSDAGATDRVVLIRPNPFDRRVSKMVRGDLRVKFSARPSAMADSRYLICETGLQTDAYNEAFRAALGAPKQLTVRSRGGDNFLTPAIAQELAWSGPGVPEVVNAKGQ